MSKEKFEMFRGNDNQFYFRLKAPNAEVIGSSEGYTTKQSAEHGIASVRVNSQNDSRYTYWQSAANSKWYFHLKAVNGEIILQSQGYTSKQNALGGIAAAKRYSPTASTVDRTLADSY